MNRKTGIGVLGVGVFFITVVYCLGCASATRKEAETLSRVYQKPYDEVWAAVEDFICNELQCVPKKLNKKKGVIETEWAHRIDTEGMVRWQILSKVKQKKDGVWVTLEKRVQMRDEVSKNLNRYKQKEKNEPTNTASGWSKAHLDAGAVREYYQGIEDRMGY